MSETSRTNNLKSLEELLIVDPQAAIAESIQTAHGFTPFRWQEIISLEKFRMLQQFGHNLRASVEQLPDDDRTRRKETVANHFVRLMAAPSFENGPYAAKQWLSLLDMLDQVIDHDAAKEMMPHANPRLHDVTSVPVEGYPSTSWGGSLYYVMENARKGLIDTYILQQIQDALPEDGQLDDRRISDCFTNVSGLQLQTVVEQVASSGIPLQQDQPKPL